jgi:methionyl-tRNA formyltransferase
MRLLLFADGVVGTEIARFIIQNYFQDIFLIVTIDDNKIYQEAKDKGIPVCIFESEQDIITKATSGIDLGFLAWWPKIIKDPLLDLPLMGFVNTHPSLLPHNRGKHYNFWALVEQAPFGVTLHRVDSGVDSGEIVAQECVDYDWCDTGETLYKKAQIAMLDLFRKTYPILRTKKFFSKPQSAHEGSFHRASELESASNISLDTKYRARDLLNLLRARTFKGHPGCWFEEDGSRFEISISITKVN